MDKHSLPFSFLSRATTLFIHNGMKHVLQRQKSNKIYVPTKISVIRYSFYSA